MPLTRKIILIGEKVLTIYDVLPENDAFKYTVNYNEWTEVIWWREWDATEINRP